MTNLTEQDKRRLYRENNNDKIRQYKRKYYLLHKQSILEKIKAYQDRPEVKLRRNEWNRTWRHNNPEKQLLSQKNHRINLRDKLFEIVGGSNPKCVICDQNDKRYLEFDHRNNDGLEDKKRFKHQYGIYRYYLEHPEEAREKLQLLCGYCNRTKRRTLEEIEKNASREG